MGKLVFYFGIILLISYTADALTGSCPLSSQHTTCTPKCLQDYECSASGGLCCPNLCNTKSCARPKQGVSSGGSSYKGSSSSATGTYCGREKCRPNQVCKLDGQTKIEKCGPK